MKKNKLIYSKAILFLLFFFMQNIGLKSQNKVFNSCGFDTSHNELLNSDSDYKKNYIKFENSILKARQNKTSFRENGDYILPVVVHIIHNGGPENISDEDVMKGIQNLNEAYDNIGYYNQNTGVKTGFQFCLAQQDPNGNPTSGINRVQSPLTNLEISSQDLQLKNLIRWDPYHYINIWLVKKMCRGIRCSVVGYAYLPAAHGGDRDGMVMEAKYFSTSKASSAVQIHEMGHYLGLLHTFQGGCKNDDCHIDGDKVCDTPPDGSTARVKCGDDFNSCSTDAQSGFSSDQNDMYWNYMDYGDFNCYSAFTEGQRQRMVSTIEFIRSSLLDSKACISPCSTNITADFSISKDTFNIGDFGNFINLSSNNASVFSWEKDGVEISTNKNLNYQFVDIGTHKFKLKVYNSDKTCYDYIIKTIEVVCSSKAKIIIDNNQVVVGESVIFKAQSTGVDTYSWEIENNVVSNSQQFNYSFNKEGIFPVQLIVSNSQWNCYDTISINMIVTCPVKANFSTSEFFPKTNTLVNFTNKSINSNSYSWSINDNSISTSKNFNHTFTDPGEYTVCLTAKNGNCMKEFCMQIFVNDSIDDDCNGVYFKIIGDENIDETCYDFEFLKNGNIAFVGSHDNNSLIFETDKNSKIIYSNTYDFLPGNEYFYNTFLDKDGYLLISGIEINTSNGRGAFLLKYDIVNKKVIWNKVIVDTKKNYPIFWALSQIPNGNYLCSGKTYGAGCDALIAEINSQSGEIIWKKTFNTGSCEGFLKTVYIDGFFYATGRFAINSSSNDKFRGVVMKMNSKGEEIWTKNYIFPVSGSSRIYPFDMVQDNGLVIAILGNETGASLDNIKMQIIKIDLNGNLIWAKGFYVENTKHNRAEKIINLPDGYLIAGDYIYSDKKRKQLIFKVDKQGDLIWAKSYQLGASTDFSSIKINNGFVYCVGTIRNNNDNDIYTMKLNFDGNMPINCNVNIVDPNLQTKNLNFFSEPIVVNDISNNMPYNNKNFTNQSIKLSENDVCKKDCIDTCEIVPDATLNIIDSQCALDSFILTFEICNQGNSTLPINTPVSFYKRNPLKYNSSIYGTYNLPDSIPENICREFSYSIRALGNETIFGFVNDIGNSNTPIDTLSDLPNTGTIECLWFNNISSYYLEKSQTTVLDLGNDISMCVSGIVTLNAGDSFESYLWSDGSTDSIFTAWEPGIYWVEVTDKCGNIQKDTINISVDKTTKVDLGEDMKICKNDSVILGLSGYSTYKWFPKNLINCENCDSIKFLPDTSVQVSVNTVDENGCFSSDTIQITVVNPKPVDLGDDRRICKGENTTFILNGFDEYKWSIADLNNCNNCAEVTYAPTSNIEISVLTKDENGCSATDTVNIDVISLNIDLGDDKTICYGDSISMQIQGFESYDWKPKKYINCSNCDKVTINTDTTIQVNLTVSDKNGCTATDSVTISVSNPHINLGKDLEICRGETIEYNIHGNNTIQWKVGNEIVKTCENNCVFIIEPENSGQISVISTNNFGCIAKDTVNFEVYYIENFTLPEDTTIFLGDEISISPIGINDNYIYHWDPSTWLSCDDCFSTTSAPLQEILYTLEVSDEHGCKSIDDILIRIKKNIDIYIPNIFTPNGDGTNDIFYIRGSKKGIKEVLKFKIFDRWGELIFEQKNFQIDNSYFGWDGTFKGQKVNPNVFVYMAVIELIDNSTIIFSGNVTVLR